VLSHNPQQLFGSAVIGVLHQHLLSSCSRDPFSLAVVEEVPLHQLHYFALSPVRNEMDIFLKSDRRKFRWDAAD
jgi:hypothetical protein